jgi:hypothetical protein
MPSIVHDAANRDIVAHATSHAEDPSMTDDAAAWEAALIADMRANGGRVTQGPLAGHPLLILTSTGAKSGQPRTAILTYHLDGDDYLVAGTAGGSPTTPAWVHNFVAEPSF